MAKKAQSQKTAADVKYGEAVAEIEQILESIDQEEIDIDDLAAKVARAVTLIQVCQERLRATEASVVQALEGLEELPEEAPAETAAPEAPEPAPADEEEDDLPF